MIVANRGNPAGWPLFRSLPGGSQAWVMADAVRKQRRFERYDLPKIQAMSRRIQEYLAAWHKEEPLQGSEEEGNGSEG